MALDSPVTNRAESPVVVPKVSPPGKPDGTTEGDTRSERTLADAAVSFGSNRISSKKDGRYQLTMKAVDGRCVSHVKASHRNYRKGIWHGRLISLSETERITLSFEAPSRAPIEIPEGGRISHDLALFPKLGKLKPAELDRIDSVRSSQ